MESYKELITGRVDKYFFRVDGDLECEICGNPYKYHPFDEEVLEFWPDFYLHKLCNGILGKT